MKINMARCNFQNPLTKPEKYDSIVVVLDTKKPSTSFKYPSNKPIYESSTTSTDSSNISLNIFLKQTNGINLNDDDLIELNDSVLVKELNHEYEKVMQISELFNSPNRIVKLKEHIIYDNLDMKTENATKGEEHLERSPSLSIPQCIVEGEDKLRTGVEESITSLPVTVDIENTHLEMLNPVTVQYTDNTSKPKRFKLSSVTNDNCTISSAMVPSISFNLKPHYCSKKDTLPLTDSEENFVEDLKNGSSDKFIPFIVTEPNSDTECYKFDFEVCIKDDSSLNTDTLNSLALEPKGLVEPDDLVFVDNCEITRSVDETLMPPSHHEVTEDTQEKRGVSSDFVIFHSLSDQFKSPVNSTNVSSDYFLNDEYFEITDQKMLEATTTVSTAPVNEPKSRKGVKRRQELTETSSTHKRPRNDRNVKAPMHKKEVEPKKHINWELYNFSKPQDCFEAVQNQWGCFSLPNPHEDLTCRFYNSPPTYTTHFSISGNTGNTIECLSIYENQIMEIEQEANTIKYNLDSFGSMWDKRVINQNLERWKKLNAMRSRLHDACDDAHRFYTYYKDNRTGWNAWYISEYHNNEIKHQFDILDAYTDFYGYA